MLNNTDWKFQMYPRKFPKNEAAEHIMSGEDKVAGVLVFPFVAASVKIYAFAIFNFSCVETALTFHDANLKSSLKSEIRVPGKSFAIKASVKLEDESTIMEVEALFDPAYPGLLAPLELEKSIASIYASMVKPDDATFKAGHISQNRVNCEQDNKLVIMKINLRGVIVSVWRSSLVIRGGDDCYFGIGVRTVHDNTWIFWRAPFTKLRIDNKSTDASDVSITCA